MRLNFGKSYWAPMLLWNSARDDDFADVRYFGVVFGHFFVGLLFSVTKSR